MTVGVPFLVASTPKNCSFEDDHHSSIFATSRVVSIALRNLYKQTEISFGGRSQLQNAIFHRLRQNSSMGQALCANNMAVPVRNQCYAGHYLERRAAMLDMEFSKSFATRYKSAGNLSGRHYFVSWVNHLHHYFAFLLFSGWSSESSSRTLAVASA